MEEQSLEFITKDIDAEIKSKTEELSKLLANANNLLKSYKEYSKNRIIYIKTTTNAIIEYSKNEFGVDVDTLAKYLKLSDTRIKAFFDVVDVTMNFEYKGELYSDIHEFVKLSSLPPFLESEMCGCYKIIFGRYPNSTEQKFFN